jgi:hypothetical protein
MGALSGVVETQITSNILDRRTWAKRRPSLCFQAQQGISLSRIYVHTPLHGMVRSGRVRQEDFKVISSDADGAAETVCRQPAATDGEWSRASP